MNLSTRLYERLEQLPQDPGNPESLQELLIVAFGAFERYYVCWKNRGDEYRQDAYALPQSLQEWLFPSDGSTRDLSTLQVVFGRGDEYFASDKNGKCENKETEVRERIPPQLRSDSPERTEMPSLRRQRTLSYIRPTSDPIPKPFSPIAESSTKGFQPPERAPAPFPIPSRPSKRRPQSMSFYPGTFARISSEEKFKALPPPQRSKHHGIPSPQPQPQHHCPCHHSPSPTKPTYVNASIQTDPSPPPTSSSSSTLFSPSARSSLSIPSQSTDPFFSNTTPPPNPIHMGRMLDYFNGPGYKLGDALKSTYRFSVLPQQGIGRRWTV